MQCQIVKEIVVVEVKYWLKKETSLKSSLTIMLNGLTILDQMNTQYLDGLNRTLLYQMMMRNKLFLDLLQMKTTFLAKENLEIQH